MSISLRDAPIVGQSHNGHRYVGHTHFWERAMMSRRQFMMTAAGTTGAVLSSGLWMPGVAQAQGSRVDPKPIPGGFTAFGVFIHHFPPGPVNEPSQITDLHGSIGLANLKGTGTGINRDTGAPTPLLFAVDNRFMKGIYIGVDGKKHTGTFGFI